MSWLWSGRSCRSRTVEASAMGGKQKWSGAACGMTHDTAWLRDIEDTIAAGRRSLGGPPQYLGVFPGAEPGVSDLHLREYLSAGKMLQRNRAEGFQAIESLAERGSVLSILFVADAIRKGDLYRLDLDKAEGWYKRAVALGSGRAMYGLGLVHLARRDLGAAIEALQAAGHRGCGAALWALGLLYRQGGEGMTSDIALARAYFERGASLGHVWASRSLALMLMTGQFGFWQRLRGYAKYLGGFIAAPLAIFGNRVDQVMR